MTPVSLFLILYHNSDMFEPKWVFFPMWWQHGEMDFAVRKVNPAFRR